VRLRSLLLPLAAGLLITPPITQALSASGSEASAVEPAVSIAPSAMLQIEASQERDIVRLHIRHAGNRTDVDSDDVLVRLAGKSVPARHTAPGVYEAQIDAAGSSMQPLEVVVAHDGIREVLSGQLTPRNQPSSSGLFGEHKQLAWWILNIIVIFIAVTAISRRKG
jgi:hypothetical protein